MANGWNVWVLLVGVARGRYIHNNYYFSLLYLYCFFLAATSLLFSFLKCFFILVYVIFVQFYN